MIWCLGPRVQILHSAEEHNLSPFDLNIACLCQSIEINNNKYVFRNSNIGRVIGVAFLTQFQWREAYVLDNCISPAPGRSSQLTHTGVEIDTCAFQTGCQLSSAASGVSVGLRFFTQFQWREAYVLDNWLLAELPQSGGRDFDPRRVHDNLSVPLWVYMRFPVPEHQN